MLLTVALYHISHSEHLNPFDFQCCQANDASHKRKALLYGIRIPGWQKKIDESGEQIIQNL